VFSFLGKNKGRGKQGARDNISSKYDFRRGGRETQTLVFFKEQKAWGGANIQTILVWGDPMHSYVKEPMGKLQQPQCNISRLFEVLEGREVICEEKSWWGNSENDSEGTDIPFLKITRIS